MTDRPINLTDWQVRAALDGRLSLVVEPVLLRDIMGNMVGIASPNEAPIQLEKGEFQRGIFHYESTDALSGPYPLNRATGDRLWVREAHYMTDGGDSEYAVYAEDKGDVEEHLENMQTTMASHPQIDWSKHLRKRPAAQLPRWASRLTLIATDVKVMRVHEIEWRHVSASGLDVYCEKFSDFWDARHAKRGLGWDENPWVTATTFTVHRCNIDQMEAQHGNS